MAIAFTCPNCLADLKLKDRYAGECVKCPRCKSLMVVPDVEHAPDAEASSAPEPSWQPSEDDWLAHLPPRKGEPPKGTSKPARAVEVGPAPSDRVKFLCTSCGTKMSAATNAAGRSVTCPTCKSKQSIPGSPNVYSDTTSAAMDQTPSRPMMPPSLPPRALASASDSLTDELDDVSLAELKAPVASPYLTGTLPGGAAAEGSRNWLLSWSTLFVAGGTLLGLLLAWVLVSAPTLYRDHVRPYLDKHVAPALGHDPARRMMRIGDELVTAGDSMTQTLRQIDSVESARRVMPQFIDGLLRISELEQEFKELQGKLTNAPPKEQMDALNARHGRIAAGVRRGNQCAVRRFPVCRW